MSAREWIDEMATETGARLLVMDGFDDCIVGIVTQFQRAFVIYDRLKVIQKLMRRDEMTEEEAWEYHESQQLSMFVGEHTPGFLDRAPTQRETAPVNQQGGAA